jgi:hypothetical protein
MPWVAPWQAERSTPDRTCREEGSNTMDTITTSNAVNEWITREVPEDWRAQAHQWVAAYAAAQAEDARTDLRRTIINTGMAEAKRRGWCTEFERGLDLLFGQDAPERTSRGTWIGANGLDRDGYTIDGWDRDGYDADGYDVDGFNRNGWTMDGYNREGFNRNGYNRDHLDKWGLSEFRFNLEGWDADGFNREGRNRQGVDRDGFDDYGVNRDTGLDREGRDAYRFDRRGLDRDGFNADGVNHNGYSLADLQNITEAQQLRYHGRTVPPRQ